jgi:hypothetical protein
MEANRSDFVFLSPSVLRHAPTGATFAAYPTPHVGYDMVVRVGRAGEEDFPSIDELQLVAWDLLQEHSSRAA